MNDCTVEPYPVYVFRDRSRLRGLHPDAVTEAARVLEYYGGDPGPLGDDAIVHVLAAYLGWLERHEADERAHAKRRQAAARAAAVTATLCEVRHQVRAGRAR